MKLVITMFSIGLLGLFVACNFDKAEEPEPTDCMDLKPTYDLQVAELINETCAYAGCHVIGGDGTGDYSSYGGALISHVEDGRFARRTFELQDMPPPDTPEDRKRTLTEKDLRLLKCWIENDYPEN